MTKPQAPRPASGEGKKKPVSVKKTTLKNLPVKPEKGGKVRGGTPWASYPNCPPP